jgi:hypothetical protein
MPPSLPLWLLDRRSWLLRVISADGQFIVGEYRRQMKAIGYLGQLDGLFGSPATTRQPQHMPTASPQTAWAHMCESFQQPLML